MISPHSQYGAHRLTAPDGFSAFASKAEIDTAPRRSVPSVLRLGPGGHTLHPEPVLRPRANHHSLHPEPVQRPGANRRTLLAPSTADRETTKVVGECCPLRFKLLLQRFTLTLEQLDLRFLLIEFGQKPLVVLR